MDYLKQYRIPFAGLKTGIHNFHFVINKEFLTHFNFPDIEDISAKLDFILHKQFSMLTLHFELDATIKTLCDRCGDELNLPIQSRQKLFVKFTGEESEKIVVISPAETEINISQYIYEFITFAIPLKKVHPEGKCNKEVIKKLNRIKTENEKKDAIDPRWQKLLKINLS